MSANFQQLANFIWSVADLLRGPYRPPQYERVMLPLTVLRRFDAVLASSKDAVLKRHAELNSKGIANIDAILNNQARNGAQAPFRLVAHDRKRRDRTRPFRELDGRVQRRSRFRR